MRKKAYAGKNLEDGRMGERIRNALHVVRHCSNAVELLEDSHLDPCSSNKQHTFSLHRIYADWVKFTFRQPRRKTTGASKWHAMLVKYMVW